MNSNFTKWFPTRRWLIVPPVIVGIVVVGALARSKKELPKGEPAERAIAVNYIDVAVQSVRPSITGYGSARPKNIWTAVAEVGGRAIEIHPMLRSGNSVMQDDVLLRIDPADYQLRIQQREADLSQAEAQLQQLVAGSRSDQQSLILQKALLEVRQSEVNRLRQLRGNAAASQSESDTAQAAYLQQALAVESLERTIALTPAQISSANAAIKLASARLDEAKRDLARTTITAPFAGLLSGVNLQPQQYVAPGQQLFELHDVDTIEVEAQFSLSQMNRLLAIGASAAKAQAAEANFAAEVTPSELLGELGATVTVRSGDVAVEFEGQPVRASGTIDEETRTIGIVVEVSSTGQLNEYRTVALRSGTYCEVVLTRQADATEIVIPRTSVRGKDVYLIDDANRLVRRAVRVRGSLRRQLIVDGLDSGDRLVVQPPTDVAEGLLVDPRKISGEAVGPNRDLESAKVAQP